MANQVSPEVVGERYTRLHSHQEALSLDVNRESIGTIAHVLVTEHEGRRDAERARMSGRSEDFRLTHFTFDSDNAARPGDVVTVKITDAAPHFLSGDTLSIRRTRGGDAFEAATRERVKEPLLVGMPTIRS